ncbi:MAG: metallophosphoesterase [Hyphomicrobiaceae bacterium]|nr:metallophosphoesterase [Hyphomicrobiaceae bacterium]
MKVPRTQGGIGMADEPQQQIRKGKLPKMVRWYNPGVLIKTGIHTVISSLFGQYADNRLMQAATDRASVDELKTRYDYSSADPSKFENYIRRDASGAFWIDYLSDIGDGFEPTYATAFLLAQPELSLASMDPLPAGQILILGGDQAYPQATREEYRLRLQNPFDWAFNVAEPQRRLFALPGNHDWYDGLSSFDSLFCVSRDGTLDRKGTKIGGWETQQHRSYWALQLPYKWWIWGPDIQFSKYLDSSQVSYFELLADQTGPDDRIVICMAQPNWLLADYEGIDAEENFFKITSIARKNGAKVHALIAGDWHHYNRYYTKDIDVHFFVAGGGGAFLHPTHILKDTIQVRWPELKVPAQPADVEPEGGDGKAAPMTERWAKRKVDVSLKPAQSGEDQKRATEGEPKPESYAPGAPAAPAPAPAEDAVARPSTVCYPPKSRSMMLSFRNLLFPLYNFKFALGIGLIYWLMTWQFHLVTKKLNISAAPGIGHSIDTVTFSTFWPVWTKLPLYIFQAVSLDIFFFVMFFGTGLVLVSYVELTQNWSRMTRLLLKVGVGTLHFLAHLTLMMTLLLLALAAHNEIANVIKSWVEGFIGMLQYQIGGSERGSDLTQQIQKPFEAAPGAAGEGPAGRRNWVRGLLGSLYPLEMIPIGGLLGGFVWGAYWVFTGFFGKMHAEQAFAALRIKDYKNFLRLRFDEKSLTVYPIGIERVPREEDLEIAPQEGASSYPSNPRLVPAKPIEVHLIEPPIVIKAKT